MESGLGTGFLVHYPKEKQCRLWSPYSSLTTCYHLFLSGATGNNYQQGALRMEHEHSRDGEICAACVHTTRIDSRLSD
jgi:hypothetical protein